ncbi:hypothetical protein SDC9_104884 [bioreactor metagenome]|uniref:TfoX N-terminal domain-containing protein n=1 Tax=bioreactor metagenome TaxID=1076179 RepID=A0A645AXT0_9ZZZZ
MASSQDYVAYIIEQLKEAGPVSAKRMFGEYGLFFEGKYFACICDNRLFVKITPAGEALMPNALRDYPYPGARLMFMIEEPENQWLMQQLIAATCAQLPWPRERKRKAHV